MSIQKQPDLQSSSGMTLLRNEEQCRHVRPDGWKCCHEIARHRVAASFEEGCTNTTAMTPSYTTTAITAEANTQARAGALMAHHPAWVGHHTCGSRSKSTVHPSPLRWRGCGCSPTAHKCHDSMSPNDEKWRTLPQHGSGASFRSTEQHKVTQVSQQQDVSESQPADGVFCTACPMKGEADWTIVHEDEHEEEILQSDDEIAMKVMINEASTLLGVVTTDKATTEGFGSQETSECSDKPSHRKGSRWTARGR